MIKMLDNLFMTSHEKPSGAADDFDSELRQLLNDSDIDSTGRHPIRWLDGAKQALVESWDNHSRVFADSLTAGDDEELGATLGAIQESIQVDFERLDDLKVGDRVCIAGYTFVMSIDTERNVGGYAITNGVRLRARVARATIARWPADEGAIIRQILDDEPSSEDDDIGAGMHDAGVMGAALVLSEVVLEGVHGADDEVLDDDETILVSLHSEGLLLGRIIHQGTR